MTQIWWKGKINYLFKLLVKYSPNNIGRLNLNLINIQTAKSDTPNANPDPVHFSRSGNLILEDTRHLDDALIKLTLKEHMCIRALEMSLSLLLKRWSNQQFYHFFLLPWIFRRKLRLVNTYKEEYQEMKATPKWKMHSSQRLLHLNNKSKTIKCNIIKIETLQSTHVYYLISTLSRRKRIGRFMEQPRHK